jgi:hypothetical protein
VIDISNAVTFTLEELARRRRVSFSTVWRWVLKGCQGPDGQRVRLEAVRLGGKWLTTDQAVQDFSDRLTPQFDDQPAAPRTPGKRERASRRAGAALERMGV